MDLNVVKLTNFETEESSQEFLNKVNSKLLLDLSKSQIVENDEWIEMVEFSLPHLEKALTKEIKNIVTEEEIIILKQNKYVKKVTSKGITYTDEFKRIFIDENGNGKLPRIIFEECGFNIDIIGMQRVKSSASRWRTAFKNGGAIKLTDTRKYNTGRPIEKDLSIEEKYKKLEAKMKLLQAENELLKKLDMIERRVLKKK